MSLSITPLSVVSAPETSSYAASSGSPGTSSGTPGNATAEPAPASSGNSPVTAASKASEPPRPPLSQQIQDLYNGGESIAEIAVQLYTTVSVVNGDLGITTTTQQVGSNVQLTA